MADRFFSLLLLICLAVISLPASAQSMREKERLSAAPKSRVYDPDSVYRSKPEVLARISAHLKKLKAEYDFDAYHVVYSGLIGQNAFRLSNDYHEAWLDEKSDGLVFVLDIQSVTGGETGKSSDLYGGQYIDEAIMPRILLAEINNLVQH
ncbi:MAG: hypothetical protein QNK83_12065 [Akkermansiaceae bacterium]